MTTTATLSRTVAPGETGMLNGVAGAFTDSASPANPNAAFNIPISNQTTPAPTNLAATGGLTRVNLTWTGIAGSATYSVYRSTTSGAETLIHSGVSGTSFADTGLTGGLYFYKVSATLSGSEGALSNEASATASDFSLSANPTMLTALAGGTTTSSITVNPIGGFSGQVTLSASDPGLGITIAPAQVTLGQSQTSGLSVFVPASTPAGDYTITVTGTSGGLSHDAIVTVSVSDFSLSVTPASLTVPPGASQSTTVSVNSLNGFSSSVSLSASGLPAGASVLFNPASVSGAGSSTATVSAGTNTPTGTYRVTITGTCGSLTRTATLSLTVTGFKLSANPATVTIPPGGSGSTTATVTGLSGFSGTVSLGVSGQPSGVTAVFAPTSVAVTGTSTLTFTASQSAVPGSYPITISGTYGGSALTTPLTLNVTDFSLSAAPASLAMTTSSSMTTAISLTPLYGFTGSAALTVTGMPSGMTPGFAPASVSSGAPSTLTLTTSSTVTQGTYPLTVSGVANGASRKTTLSITVSNPQVTVTVGPLTSPSLGQQNQNNVYVGVPCIATITASATPLPGGYSASQLVATWSQYSMVYLFYSPTGGAGTWNIAVDGSSVTPTLNGPATSPAGTFKATFMQAGYYQICIGTTVSFSNPTTNQTFGPYTGYGFASNSPPPAAAAAPALSASQAAQSTPLQRVSAATPQAATPAGVPPATGDVKVADGGLFFDTLDGSSYVRLKSKHPSNSILFTTPVKLLTTFTTATNVVVSCPGGQVGFSLTPNPTTDSPTLPVTVAGSPDGTQSMQPAFYVTGKVVSSKVNDVEIDLKDAKTNTVYSKTNLTVFGFTNPKMNITSDGSYSLSTTTVTRNGQQVPGTRFAATPTAVALSAQVDIIPSGVDVTVDPISRLKLNVIQNGYSRTDSVSCSNPYVAWAGAGPQPQFINVPISFSGTASIGSGAILDCLSSSTPPFYDNSLSTTIAYPTTQSKTTYDGPLLAIASSFSPPLSAYRDSNGKNQLIRYSVSNMTIATSFEDWCTIYDSTLPATHQDEWLCESSWSLNVGSAASATATIGTLNSTSFSDTPVESGTLYNTLVQGEAIGYYANPNTEVVNYPSSTP